jgi:hypothetical protein
MQKLKFKLKLKVEIWTPSEGFQAESHIIINILLALVKVVFSLNFIEHFRNVNRL